MPSADQVPVKSSHSKVLWPKWVVLITGSTGLHYVLSALSNRSFTPVGAVSCFISELSSKSDGLSVALPLGHHRPRHPRDLVGQGDGRDLGRPTLEQGGEPRPVSGAMDLGVSNDGERTGTKQGAQISIAFLGDAAELLLAAARTLFRHQSDPGREIASRSKDLGIRNAGDDRSG